MMKLVFVIAMLLLVITIHGGGFQVRACGRNCHFMSLESDHMEEGCEEMYVVKEGDTLQSISAKCNDPFILEENPFIQQDNDVYPGLVIKITPYYTVD